ncbi:MULTISPECIES: phospholipase D-like domain-containing protein [Pseudomonas]|uniref:phospholipase D-like domain-containing protein n=1 Tax=Pseudomonas TaxID=286 RepID=UPI001C49991B|nr:MULTISPECIES: phospholipase D-like domain-containing protein [Pseudomonas]|tara:strand:+ start:851 stop:4063 length:3213 start_codon:yes stop_codon:yes gene_type:complete
MTDTSAYNGIRAKQVNQVNSAEGQAYTAYSTPDYFLTSESAFAPKRSGNNVRFFTTGDDYFKDVAAAIDEANETIFITGWQINYDVLLDGQRTLWQCLHQALTRKPQLRAYVAPWLSPSGSLGTFDVDTMLAIFQLNAGLQNGPRAFCVPATQQSDMGGLGVAFSHHQKSVVIDNRVGYVGGIDLAYGRRDDNNFSLDATTRKGNDARNPCIPQLGWMEIEDHVSRNGLIMAALLDLSKASLGGPTPSRAEVINSFNYVIDFFSSPRSPVLQSIVDGVDRIQDAAAGLSDAITEIKYKVLEHNIRSIAKLIESSLNDFEIAPQLRQEIQRWLSQLQVVQGNITESLRVKSSYLIAKWSYETGIGRTFAALFNGGYNTIPEHAIQPVSELATTVFWHLHNLLQTQAASNEEAFPYLLEYPQSLASADNSCLAPDQPRMPWQDVHCRIEGPSVYDLSRNFIDRWNSQQAYLANSPPFQNTTLVKKALDTIATWINQLLRMAHLHHFLDANDLIQLDFQHAPPVWINEQTRLPVYPETIPKGMSVQVLRSAANNMQQQEQRGRLQANVHLPAMPDFTSSGVQSNCKDAMLQAISSAQHFIYIENQFFQSDFGADGERFASLPLSGPMASLRDPRTLRQDFVARVRLVEALEAKDVWQLDWPEIDAIARNADEESNHFLEQMFAMLGVNAQGWVTDFLSTPQDHIINTVGSSLASRISKAIDEGNPFHVYMVLPVHPEGTLNTPNIMHQIHLTMQSLVFGENSLIKNIQRHMALRAFIDRGDSPEEAAERINNIDPRTNRPLFEQQDWSKYLTLLNLRTWGELSGKVVTEQIYVHSKLLIADDRVAILGSANINDRSLLGSRDSELAVVVRDSTPVTLALDGVTQSQVGKAIYEFRASLWRKHFGLSLTGNSKIQPATELIGCWNTPAAESTWKAIQKISTENTREYEKSFVFIPRNQSQVQAETLDHTNQNKNKLAASVWPTWSYRDANELRKGGLLAYPMPYEKRFWRSLGENTPPVYPKPKIIKGFMCQLPSEWTRGENNDSGLNLKAVATLTEPEQPLWLDVNSEKTNQA